MEPGFFCRQKKVCALGTIRQTPKTQPIILVSSLVRERISLTVYVDLVFFSNLAMDGVVLLTTAKVRRADISRFRLLAAAAVGAAYAAIMFVAHTPYLYSFAAKVAVSLLMVLLCFGYGGPLQLVRNFGAFYAVSFAALGGVIGIGFLLRSLDAPWAAMSLTDGGGIALEWRMQLVLFALAFLLAVWLFRQTAETRRRRDGLERQIWEAEVRLDNRSWTVRAMVDTGNRLYDPLTRMPVMIMEAGIWRQELPDGWCERLRGESADRLVAELDAARADGFAWAHRLRLVPYRAVNGTTRMMLALKPDGVLLSCEGQSPRLATRLLIGLDGGALSSESAYRAILHPDLIGQDKPEARPADAMTGG